jgi:radical SAM protein with 4Fe4S-binding SPASM domain
MVETCKRAGCMVTFHTNGLLLTPEKSEALVAAGLDHITISLDGATPETYREVRGADLDLLEHNLRALDRIKAAHGTRYPRVMFKWVLMKKNLHELATLVELAAACGAEEIELNNLIVYHRALADEALFDQRGEVAAVVEDAMRKAEPHGIRVFYGGIEEKDGIPACPFRNFTVTCDGTVGPCGAQRFAMGNIHDHGLRELWNHEALVEMRLGYARRELPTQCQRCPGRTNKPADHEQPELGYVEQTLQVRQWQRTDRYQSPRPQAIDPPRPPCNPSTPAAGGGCSTGGGCSA